jgi:hypothetical protein
MKKTKKLPAAILSAAMAQIGSIGGRAKSLKKTLAVRANARRPRPNRRKKSPIPTLGEK